MADNGNNNIEKGLEIARRAIASCNSKQLAYCLQRLKEYGTPAQDLAGLVAECPISVLKEAGIALKIHSEINGKDIVLGQDIAWDAVSALVTQKPPKSEVSSILEAMDVLVGVVEAVELVGAQTSLL